MKIYLGEITDQETILDFTEDDDWIMQTIAGIDESRMTDKRTVDVQITLRKIDDFYMVGGRVKTTVNLLCSRCGIAYNHACDQTFSSLFSPDAELAGEPDLNHITGDSIDLSEVLAEQIRLQLPLQPLCRDDCKGICAHCGADLNRGARCSCETTQITNKQNPFASLADRNLRN